jgi:hypothetical protein
MSTYTEAVRRAADTLEAAETNHRIRVEQLATVRNHNGQSGYAVTVNGIRVDVSICDSRTYQGTLIRGREMIHLGALKALGSEVDFYATQVKAARAALAALIK